MNASDVAPLQQEGVKGQPIQKIAAKPKSRLFTKGKKKQAPAPPPMAAPMGGGFGGPSSGGF